MATYNVTAPDGTKYQVTAPDDATQDQVMAYVQAQHGQSSQTAQPQSPADLNAAYWKADAAGDEAGKQAAFQQLRAQGGTLGAPDEATLQQVTQRENPAQAQTGLIGTGQEMAVAAAHHLANIPYGVGQLALHGANAVSGGALAGATSDYDKMLQNREAEYQQVIPNSPASYAGAAIGEVAPWVTGIGELRAAGLIPQATTTLGKIGSLAAEGGAIGAAQPVTSGNYATQKSEQIGAGAATGPVLMGAGGLIKGVGGIAQHVLNPQAVADANVASLYGSSPDVVARLGSAAQHVQGETPTAAQVLQTPQAVQAERMLRNRDPVPFVNQENAANQARLDVVQNIAGLDGQVQAAKTARDAAVTPYRENVLSKTTVDPTPIVDTLNGLAKNANPVVRGAAGEALNVIQMNLNPDGTVPATVLDDIRQEGGKLMAKYATNGVVGSSENARFGPVVSQIATTLNQSAPGYSDYLAAYAKHSEPINTMESAQKLLDPNAPGSLNTAGDPQLAIARVKQLLRQDDNARYPMSPQARAQLEGVRDSLMRRSASNAQIGASGPQTAADLQAQNGLSGLVFGRNLGAKGGVIGRVGGGGIGALVGTGIGGLHGAIVGGALGSGLGDALGVANQRVIQRIAQSAASAPEARAAIARYLQRTNKNPSILNYYLYGTPRNALQSLGSP